MTFGHLPGSRAVLPILAHHVMLMWRVTWTAPARSESVENSLAHDPHSKLV